MIHFHGSACIPQNLGNCPLDDRPTAGWTPIALCFLAHHRVALAAHPFHIESLPHPRFAASLTLAT